MKRKIMGLFLAIVLCVSFMPVDFINAAKVITNNDTGTYDGFNYELWKDNGNTTMTLNEAGTFSCSWSNINNALFRTGRKFDCTKTWQELGNISVDYDVDYQPNGNSYMCIYGWTRSPLIEYYIVDSWGTWRPPGTQSKGQITVDGGTYDVYTSDRINQPSIDGNTTFKQFWSVRTSKKTSGTISVSKHFEAWTRMGMELGKMYECALTIEGYQSSGQATVKKNVLNIGGATPTQAPTQAPTQRPTQAPTPTPTSWVPTTTPQPTQYIGSGLPAGITCEYQTVSNWGSGYQAQIVIKNNSNQSYNGWNFSFNTNSQIQNLWGAEMVGQSGGKVTVKNPSWDSNFAPGRTFIVYYVANGSAGAPSGYTFG